MHIHALSLLNIVCHPQRERERGGKICNAHAGRCNQLPPPSFSMIPSSSAPRRSPCPCCRRRRRNAAAGRPASSVTARALAAGLWRLRQSESSAARRQDDPPSLIGGRKMKSRGGFGVGKQQLSCCRNHGNGILDKIEAACSSSYYGISGAGGSTMEKATKWDYLNNNNNGSKLHGSMSSSRRKVVALEAALEKARAQMSVLEDDRRVVTKKLRKVAEEKAWWKSKPRCAAAAALREELKMERHHRRQLEAASAKLLKELASARQRVETERKARELMEEACEELSKEVEEDQAEVEAMREEMEEERRMLQMAEVWREERVQMKLSDARAVLEHKYTHLNTLQAEMESFLLRLHNKKKDKDLLLRTIDNRMATFVRGANHEFLSAAAYKSPHAPEDVDKVFDHFHRKNNATDTNRDTAVTRSSSSVASPATDLFLGKVDTSTVDDVDGGWAWERGTPLRPDRFNNGGSGVTEGGSGRSRRSGGNLNTTLIRRLWRTSSSSSSGRNRVVQNGCSPSYSDRDRERETPPSQGGSAADKEKDMRRRKKPQAA